MSSEKTMTGSKRLDLPFEVPKVFFWREYNHSPGIYTSIVCTLCWQRDAETEVACPPLHCFTMKPLGLNFNLFWEFVRSCPADRGTSSTSKNSQEQQDGSVPGKQIVPSTSPGNTWCVSTLSEWTVNTILRHGFNRLCKLLCSRTQGREVGNVPHSCTFLWVLWCNIM